MRQSTLTQKNREDILRLSNEGYSIRSIANKLDIDRGKIQRFLACQKSVSDSVSSCSKIEGDNVSATDKKIINEIKVLKKFLFEFEEKISELIKILIDLENNLQAKTENSSASENKKHKIEIDENGEEWFLIPQ